MKMYLYSALVPVVIIVVQVLADEPAQKVQQIQQEDEEAEKVIQNCALETSVNLTAIFHPDYDGSEPNFSCFFKCTFMTLGFVDENGNTNITKYYENFDQKEGAVVNLETCLNTTRENICDKVLESQVCILNYFNLEDLNTE